MANGSTTLNQFPKNLPIFKIENYERWIAQMKVIFRFQDLVETVYDGVSGLETITNDTQKATHKEKSKNDEKALLLIHQCMDPNIF